VPRPHPTTSATPERLPYGVLLVLATAVFLMVTSEFLPTGLLPQLAEDLEVSVPQAGLLITVFAATVVVSATPLALLTRRYSRKRLLVVLLVVFALANLLAASAPAFGVLVIARVLGGLVHGLFWSIVNPYVVLVSPPHLLARAISLAGAGGTAAFVLGVPLGTALGTAVGWRMAFVVVAAAVLVVGALVVFLLPPVSHLIPVRTGEIPLPLHRDRSLPAILAVCGVVVLLLVGQNTFYTYIAPWLIQVAGVAEGGVAGVLFIYGAAGVIGLAAAAWFGDRRPTAALVAGIVGTALAVVLVSLTAGASGLLIASIVVWSACFGALPALLQTRAMRVSSPSARDFTSAAMTTAFNAAIGGGALLGGVLIDASGVEVLPAALVVLVLAGLAAVLVLRVRDRRVRAAVAVG